MQHILKTGWSYTFLGKSATHIKNQLELHILFVGKFKSLHSIEKIARVENGLELHISYEN